jgi:hypothetical protein
MPVYTLPSGGQFIFPNTFPYAPDVDDVATAIRFYLQTYIQPEQFNGTAVIKTITDGVCKNFTASCPVASVIFLGGLVTGREFGGGVENGLHFELDFLADATNAAQAEAWVRLIYKLAVSLFESQAVLQGTNGSNSTYDARIVDESPKTGFITQGVPFPLRAFAMEIVVLQHWFVQNGIQQ